VIYASAPPATTLLVADDLSRKARIPWVAELRDLWTDNPYYNYAAVRRDFERSWEKGVLGRTAAIVTVSPGWRRRLADRHGKPVAVAMNGFVATDFPFAPPADPETSGPLRIVFTGHVYAGYRDPSPLFEALQRLRASANDVVVEFIGTKDKDGALDALAKQYGLSDHVRVLPPVSYKQALDYQLRADVLLHMQWCDPKEQGTIAGKIFDYLGARRPILGIALEDCVVADLVHERKAGLVTNDPQKIAAQVERWIAEKRAGGVKPLPPAASEGLDRAAQFDKLVDLLKSVAKR
jgi:glycosyltransferase involved in cell wall biosynthesis